MAYTKTVWVNDQSPDIDADNLNKMEQGIADAQFPEEGVSGQLLAKTIDGQEWVDAPNSAVWGLIAGDIEDQIDLNETFGKEKELTQAQYDALPSSKLTDDVAYYIKDGTDIPAASVISASGVQYDNTASGLTADDVQDAIDENANEIADTKSDLESFESTHVDRSFHLYSKTEYTINCGGQYSPVLLYGIIQASNFVALFNAGGGSPQIFYVYRQNTSLTITLTGVNSTTVKLSAGGTNNNFHILGGSGLSVAE